MQWVKNELKDIARPFNLRGFYNRYRQYLLKDRSYPLLHKKIDELRQEYLGSGLELGSLKHLKIDIECDKERFDECGWVPNTLEEYETQKKKDEIMEMENAKYGENDFEYKTLLQKAKVINDKVTRVPTVEIKVLRKSKNMEAKVMDEMFRIAIETCENQTEMGRLLGISVRTVRNRLNYFLKRGMQ